MPAAPQDLVITNAGQNGQYPILSWDANTEPDLDHYNIYRKMGSANWSFVTNTTNTTWTDFLVIIDTSGPLMVHYRIRAVDNENNESDYSNMVNTRRSELFKDSKDTSEETNIILPQEISLQQNYPNPFNPTTNIRFALPNAAHISLKIYNLLGEEIRTLVNGNSAAGFHTIRWDGKNPMGKEVPSGIYIYRMVVNSSDNGASLITQSRKMTLLR